ncbi:glycosyltransferase family 1 protein [Klebsiella oxytoca]|uniref:glycosyltransferase family 4 protein n=1 Tax=Klebsiella oxytoca TaxID=571 RepID=UPI0004168F19|nr:glycosyltransferase family 1 protein [Klebsiella oxytoca]EIX9046907.1 glycosyltransferase family 4 protein [Klebsiella oxytoca]EIZ1086822.1 glycosyltransferase family 4 protein [Klebsiella oxytoca]EKK0457507.1 glycosyltransferase family 4 protein [Klebsiella oxytoca]ELI8948297.1 glycosyltransferase family 4 protein [Klebsiella oxytoca]ELK0755646.1 glycosyltransferase family 4 protein [Klebsiella oxytoca]
MKKVLFDRRWEGGHGIGRFSKEITNRIQFDKYICNKIKPTSPVDIFITPWYLCWNRFLYFTPGFNAPFFFVKRSVITIHDLNHVDIDNNSNILKRIYYNLVLKRACKKCLAILTVSEFSKKRIIEWSGIEKDKVTVVGNGVSDSFTPNGEVYKPGYDYIFCVSNRKEHKNEKRLIEAYSLIAEKNHVKLVFSGKPSSSLHELIKNYNLEDNIIFTGFISDEMLPNYYRGALVLIMPSIYEGFGLPVIEAMACGIPTIASATTSLGEIAGDASLLIDPFDVESIKDALEKIISDQMLQKELKIKGLEHVKKYTWGKTVNKVKVVIDSLR